MKDKTLAVIFFVGILICLYAFFTNTSVFGSRWYSLVFAVLLLWWMLVSNKAVSGAVIGLYKKMTTHFDTTLKQVQEKQEKNEENQNGRNE